jgi:N-acyl-D-amino-acid deacylase
VVTPGTRRSGWRDGLLLGALTAGGALLSAGSSGPRYDLVIAGGRIVDGSGAPWYRADVGIAQGRIARIGAIPRREGRELLEAEGRFVVPGFIDVHMHVEEDLPERPDAENLIADGATTIVTGNCGGSEISLLPWFERLEGSGVAVNVGSLIGHNTVRQAVLGGAARRASPREMAQMEALVRRSMAEGALGFSTGLIYAPGTFAPPSEVAALARAAARSGGIYATHLRSENEKVFEAVDEAIAAAKEAGAPLQISHFKVTSRRLWGSSTRMLESVERARRQGVDVAIDQYPYTASSSGLEVLLPDWALESKQQGSRAALRQRLSRPALRRKMARQMYERIHGVLGRDHLDYAVVASFPPEPSLEGRSLMEIARSGGRVRTGLREEIAAALALCARGAAVPEGGGACGTQMVYHVLDERDVERIFRHPLTMVARDGGVPEPGRGRPHPRSYGAAARVLGSYVRARRLVPLEEAVRKMTSLPAQRFGLHDRGLLREGFWADLALVDPARVEDAATFETPHALSRGIDDVLVNGSPVRRSGRATGLRPGRILRGRGAERSGASAGRALRLDPGVARASHR